MPADDCPSFHCRPSTASTFFPPSLSIRQMPTTGTSDFGSAPTVSLEKSILSGCAARTRQSQCGETDRGHDHRSNTFCFGHHRAPSGTRTGFHPWRPSAPPPGECDQERQPADEPQQCRVRARDQRVAGILVARIRGRRLHARQGVEQRQDLAGTGRTADVGSAAIGDIRSRHRRYRRRCRQAFRPLCARTNRDVRHRAIELRQHVALQIEIARVLGDEIYPDHAAAVQASRAIAGRRQETSFDDPA